MEKERPKKKFVKKLFDFVKSVVFSVISAAITYALCRYAIGLEIDFVAIAIYSVILIIVLLVVENRLHRILSPASYKFINAVENFEHMDKKEFLKLIDEGINEIMKNRPIKERLDFLGVRVICFAITYLLCRYVICLDIFLVNTVIYTAVFFAVDFLLLIKIFYSKKLKAMKEAVLTGLDVED